MCSRTKEQENKVSKRLANFKVLTTLIFLITKGNFSRIVFASLHCIAIILSIVLPADSANSIGNNIAATPFSIKNLRTIKRYSNLNISNKHGPCITISDSSHVEILDSNIGPCKGAGVDIKSSSHITLSGNDIHDTDSNGIQTYKTTNVNIIANKFARNSSSIYALLSSSLSVKGNSFLNVLGPKPRGQFIQFNRVSGPYNEIVCNIAISQMGKGAPEDGISIYRSSGTLDSYLLISSNIINGGGPSGSGGGIMIGDGGSTEYVSATGNILINPGQYGIAVAGGSHIKVSGNLIYGRSQPFTNVGLYVWNQSPSQCNNVDVTGNKVYWINSRNKPNPFWNAKNCGELSGESQPFSWSPWLINGVSSVRPKDCRLSEL